MFDSMPLNPASTELKETRPRVEKKQQENTDGAREQRGGRNGKWWLFEWLHSSFLHLKCLQIRQVEGGEIKPAAIELAAAITMAGVEVG